MAVLAPASTALPSGSNSMAPPTVASAAGQSQSQSQPAPTLAEAGPGPSTTSARLSFGSTSTKSGKSIRSILSGKTGKLGRAKSRSVSTSSGSTSGDDAQDTPSRAGASTGNGNGSEDQQLDAGLGGPSATPSPKPTKKSTVDELRTALEEFGLDTKGKKDTLFKRLLHAFRRAQTTVTTSNQTELPEADGNAARSASVFDAASPSRVNPYLNYNPQGLSPKAWGKQPCRAFLCFDVEATCRGGKEFSWPNEIIEFPVVLVKWDEEEVDDDVSSTANGDTASNRQNPFFSPTVEGDNAQAGPSSILADTDASVDAGANSQKRRLKIVDTFHSYVRPTWTTELSEFCVKFTGITQEMVDASPTFPDVLRNLEKWLRKHDLLDGEGLSKAMWVTDGPWDLRDFIPKQLHITPCDPSYPLYLRQPYLNIKQAFQTVLSEEYRRRGYAADHPGVAPNARALSRITTGKLVGKDGQERLKGLGFYSTITGMIEKLELGVFEGRQHCGLDDATNVARILIALAEKDVLFVANAKLPPPNGRKKWPWMGQPGEVNWEEWMSDARTPPLATTVPPTTSGSGSLTPAQAPPAVTETASASGNTNMESETVGDTSVTALAPDAGGIRPAAKETAAIEASHGSDSRGTDPSAVVAASMEEEAGPVAKPPSDEP